MRKSSCPNLLRTWRHSQQGLTWPMVLASSACRERNSVSPWPFLDSMVILDSNQTNKKWGNVALKHLCQVWAIRLILNSSGKIHPWIRISALALILVLMCSLSCWGCTGVYIIYISWYRHQLKTNFDFKESDKVQASRTEDWHHQYLFTHLMVGRLVQEVLVTAAFMQQSAHLHSSNFPKPACTSQVVPVLSTEEPAATTPRIIQTMGMFFRRKTCSRRCW